MLRILAELALHEDRPLAAREYLEKLLQMDPGDKRARATLARLMPADAREIRETIREGAPTDPTAVLPPEAGDTGLDDEPDPLQG